MNKILNSHGFSALEVALVIIVMGIIGGTGAYVYNSQKDTNKLLDASARSSEVTVSPKPKAETKDETIPAPPITFRAETSFDKTDREQIMDRIVDPLVFYHTNVIKIELKDVVVEKSTNMMSDVDYRFILNYANAKEPGKHGLMFGDNNRIGYWQPALCDHGGCQEYPIALKTKFPKSFKAYQDCQAAANDKERLSELACM